MNKLILIILGCTSFVIGYLFAGMMVFAMTEWEQYQQDPAQQQLVSNQIDFYEQNISHSICCQQFGEGVVFGDVRK